MATIVASTRSGSIVYEDLVIDQHPRPHTVWHESRVISVGWLMPVQTAVARSLGTVWSDELQGHNVVLWGGVHWTSCLHPTDWLRLRGWIYSHRTMGGLTCRPGGLAHYYNESRSQVRSFCQTAKTFSHSEGSICKSGLAKRNGSLAYGESWWTDLAWWP